MPEQALLSYVGLGLQGKGKRRQAVSSKFERVRRKPQGPKTSPIGRMGLEVVRDPPGKTSPKQTGRPETLPFPQLQA